MSCCRRSFLLDSQQYDSLPHSTRLNIYWLINLDEFPISEFSGFNSIIWVFTLIFWYIVSEHISVNSIFCFDFFSGGYGNVGVLSGASSSSNSDFGGQARAISANFGGNGGNTYTVGNGNSAPIYSVESSDDVDDMVQNGNFGSSNGASASTFSSNGGNIFVGSRGLGNNGVQVVQVDSGPAQNIAFQIQSTVQDILNRFGITMQNNVAGMSGLYQPGRTFVVRFNGAPRILNSNRYLK